MKAMTLTHHADVNAKLDLLLDKVAGLEQRLETSDSPHVHDLLERLDDPRVQTSLRHLSDPDTLEAFAGLANGLTLMQAGLTDDMIEGLVAKVTVLAELVLDPFMLDALQTLARALKAGQAEYPDEKVPPIGGLFAALRAANDPDTRRVAAFALALMRNLGKEFA